MAIGVFQYFTFINDYSRNGYVYLMKYKSKSFEKFREFKNEIEKQSRKNIKVLRFDCGDKYLSTKFEDYLKENGIIF